MGDVTHEREPEATGWDTVLRMLDAAHPLVPKQPGTPEEPCSAVSEPPPASKARVRHVVLLNAIDPFTHPGSRELHNLKAWESNHHMYLAVSLTQMAIGGVLAVIPAATETALDLLHTHPGGT